MGRREQTPIVMIYTDGACNPNPGSGGYAARLVADHSRTAREITGGEPDTTNNRMELTAAIQGLNALKTRSDVTIITDSEYLEKGINGRLDEWRGRGKLASVANADLWQQLNHLLGKHDVRAVWVRGHSGHPENEWVNHLANEAARRTAREGCAWHESRYVNKHEVAA